MDHGRWESKAKGERRQGKGERHQGKEDSLLPVAYRPLPSLQEIV